MYPDGGRDEEEEQGQGIVCPQRTSTLRLRRHALRGKYGPWYHAVYDSFCVGTRTVLCMLCCTVLRMLCCALLCGAVCLLCVFPAGSMGIRSVVHFYHPCIVVSQYTLMPQRRHCFAATVFNCERVSMKRGSRLRIGWRHFFF